MLKKHIEQIYNDLRLRITNEQQQNDDVKTRKIRQLQYKISRQEEETKKKFDELQSKQSRLENALKLLIKQTSSYKKRRQQTHDHVEGKSSSFYLLKFFFVFLSFLK